MRNASNWLPHRVLAKMPAGAHVLLRDGSVWTKGTRAWMPAGWIIPQPLTAYGLTALNGGSLPTRLVPTTDLLEVAA